MEMIVKKETRPREGRNGNFTAVRDGKTLVSARTHRELVDALTKQGIDLGDVTFEYVRPQDRPCAY